MTLSRSKQPVPLALALGVLGAAAIIVTTQVATSGPVVYYPYTALVLASLVAVRLAGWDEFRDRFAAAFLAFMTATVVVYLFAGTVETGNLLKVPVWQHVAVLGTLTGVGAMLSAAVAYVADLGRARRG